MIDDTGMIWIWYGYITPNEVFVNLRLGLRSTNRGRGNGMASSYRLLDFAPPLSNTIQKKRQG